MELTDLYTGMIIIFSIILIYLLYVAWKQDKEEIKKMYRVAHNYIARTKNINNIPYEQYHEEIKENMKNIFNKREKKSIYNRMVNSCYTGLIRGGAVGLASGKRSGAFAGAIMFGIINPIVLYIQEIYLPDEQLPIN